MATLTVRKLADTTYENLGKRAKQNNRSLEAEVREILDREAKTFDIQAWVSDLREFRKGHALKPRLGEDAVSMVRAVRDE
jgi:plasmid stability protein